MHNQEYKQAQKKAQKDVRHAKKIGFSPFLQAFDDIDISDLISSEYLPVQEIPADLVVGTFAKTRVENFSYSFLPLLDEDSEFAYKWSHLFKTHIEEGIREPVKLIEYMHRYFVVEGHKRVSVLKHLGSRSLSAEVRRFYPPKNASTKPYYAFLQFSKLTGLNNIIFQKEEDYIKLWTILNPKADNKEPKGELENSSNLRQIYEPEKSFWQANSLPTNIIYNLRSFFNLFSQTYSKIYLPAKWYEEVFDLVIKTRYELSEAFLCYLKIKGFVIEDLSSKDILSLEAELKNMEKEFGLIRQENELYLLTEDEEEQSSFYPDFSKFIQRPSKKVCFIHTAKAAESRWVYEHEMGRFELERNLKGQVTTFAIESVDTSEKASTAFSDAATFRANVIFVTSPFLAKDAVKFAIDHPEIMVFVYSLKLKSASVYCYSVRMFETEFLKGIIAASTSQGQDLAYVVPFPAYGTIASINAFARGVQMIKSRAKVHLVWQALNDRKAYDEALLNGISHFAKYSMLSPLISFINLNSDAKKDLHNKSSSNDKTAQPFLRISTETAKIAGSVLLGQEAKNKLKWLYGEQNLAREYCSEELWPLLAKIESTDNEAITIFKWSEFYTRIMQGILRGKINNSGAEAYAFNFWWGLMQNVIDVLSPLVDENEAGRQLFSFIKEGVIRGKLRPFAGLVRDQNLAVKSSSHSELSMEEILLMDWLNENIVGFIPDKNQLNEKARLFLEAQDV